MFSISFLPCADFGPIVMTSNADIFKGKINSLTADGGGDTPEMALSGLQVLTTQQTVFHFRQKFKNIIFDLGEKNGIEKV